MKYKLTDGMVKAGDSRNFYVNNANNLTSEFHPSNSDVIDEIRNLKQQINRLEKYIVAQLFTLLEGKDKQ